MSVVALIIKTKKYIKNNKKRLVFILGLICFLYCVLMFYKNNINKIVNETVEIKCQALAVKAMNLAIGDVVMDKVVYDELVNIVTNENGEISVERMEV